MEENNLKTESDILRSKFTTVYAILSIISIILISLLLFVVQRQDEIIKITYENKIAIEDRKIEQYLYNFASNELIVENAIVKREGEKISIILDVLPQPTYQYQNLKKSSENELLKVCDNLCGEIKDYYNTSWASEQNTEAMKFNYAIKFKGSFIFTNNNDKSQIYK